MNWLAAFELAGCDGAGATRASPGLPTPKAVQRPRRMLRLALRAGELGDAQKLLREYQAPKSTLTFGPHRWSRDAILNGTTGFRRVTTARLL